MEQLKELNGGKDSASRSMVTFLALNTSAITLIPTTVISIRMTYESANPTEIVGVTFIAQVLSMIGAIWIDRYFYRRRSRKGRKNEHCKYNFLMGNPLCNWFYPLYGTIKKVPTYESFVEGGKEGIQIAISILPFMVGMLVSISIFRSSGALDAMISVMKPMLDLIHVPAEIVPLALIRPISGSAGLSITTDLIATYGPDSFIGRLASTMQGSTDTTFYILTVYFGAVGIRKMGDALKVGLLQI